MTHAAAKFTTFAVVAMFMAVGCPPPPPAPTILVSTTNLDVPEGGTATFTVALSAAPTASLTVRVTQPKGDDPLTVASGGTLVFTADDFAQPRLVTIAAGEDDDVEEEETTFDVSAEGLASVQVTARTVDNDALALSVDPQEISVAEGGTNTFAVALTAAPNTPVTVDVVRVSGDPDLSVSNGASLSFTAANFDQAQTVTIAAAEDTGIDADEAIFEVSADGLTSVQVTAREVENDQLSILADSQRTIQEDSNATLPVSLSIAPAAPLDVTVTKVSGDDDITLAAGASLTFTDANFNQPQNVIFSAAEDVDAEDGEATFEISATGVDSVTVLVREVDNDELVVVFDPTQITVPEGESAEVFVSLSAAPADTETVTVTRTAGDPDINLAEFSQFTFTAGDFDVPQRVLLSAANDNDVSAGQATFQGTGATAAPATFIATEGERDAPTVVVTPMPVSVPEGESVDLFVTLSRPPLNDIVVTLERLEGDPDLVPTEQAITFDNTNYDVPAAFQIAAGEDDDAVNGSAIFRAAGAGAIAAQFTAMEIDSDRAPQILGSYRATPLNFLGLNQPPCDSPDGPITFDTVSRDFARAPSPDLATGTRLAIPALQLGDGIPTDTAIHLQKEDGGDAVVLAVFFDSDGDVVGKRCSGAVQTGSNWVWTAHDIPSTAASAILYSLALVSTGQGPAFCPSVDVTSSSAAFEDFDFNFQFGAIVHGSPFTALITRGPVEPEKSDGANVTAYSAFTAPMYQGADFALPEITTASGADTILHLHNPAETVAQFVLTLVSDDSSASPMMQAGFVGPRLRQTLRTSDLVGADFRGSATIQTDIPLAVLADIVYSDGIATYAAVPAGVSSSWTAPVVYQAGSELHVAATTPSTDAGNITVTWRDAAGGVLAQESSDIPASGRAVVQSPDLIIFDEPTGGSVLVESNTVEAIAPVLVARRFDGADEAIEHHVHNMLITSRVVGDLDTGTVNLALPLVRRVETGGPAGTSWLLHNANPNPGTTVVSVFPYHSASGFEPLCFELGPLETRLLEFDFAHLGKGFKGAALVTALESDQGIPALAAVAWQRPAGAPVIAPEPPQAPDFDALSVVMGAYEDTRLSRAGKVFSFPFATRIQDRNADYNINTMLVDNAQRIGLLALDTAGEVLFNSLAGAPTPVFGTVNFLNDLNDSVVENVIVLSLPDTPEAVDMFLNTSAAEEVSDLIQFVDNGRDDLFVANIEKRLNETTVTETYPALGGPMGGLDDPVNGGFGWIFPQVYAGTERDTTLRVQNLGPLPAILELAFLPEGESPTDILWPDQDWRLDGGGLAARAGILNPVHSTTLRLADYFGERSGRLLLRSSQRLSVSAETIGSLTLSPGWPESYNFADHFDLAFHNTGGRMLYAPFWVNPAAVGFGAELPFSAELTLVNTVLVGSAQSTQVLIEIFDTNGDLIESVLRQIRPNEPLREDFMRNLPTDVLNGWVRVSVLADREINNASLAGALRLGDPNGPAIEYHLVPDPYDDQVPQMKGFTGFRRRLFVDGVTADLQGRATNLLFLNTSLESSQEITIRAYDENGFVPLVNKGINQEVEMTLQPGEVELRELSDFPSLPANFHGGIRVQYFALTEDQPPVIAAALNTISPFKSQ